MSEIKRRLVIVFFEFFRDVKLEDLERKIRALQKKGDLPPFSMMIPMVHYKGLKVGEGYQDILKKEIPFVINPKEYSRGKYDGIVRREQKEQT